MGNKTIWPLIPLINLSIKIGSGATPRGGKESYKSEGITLIRSQNVYDFQFEFSGLAFIDENQATELDNVAVEPTDILLNITGASVARCCIVPKNILPARVNQHVSIVRINPDIADPRFVLYVINSPYYKKFLLTIAQGGATREALTKEKIETFKIPYPPPPTQRKIAAILSAYDDLIENNTCRIRILEQMGQAIYREWFIHLRFPGHQQARFTDSPLGRIPEGWEVVKLNDVCHLTMGQSPKSEFYNTNGIGLPFHQGVTDFGDRFPAERLYCAVEARIAEQGDILFSVRAPVGRINIANMRMVIGRGLSAIRHKAGYQWFAYHLLKENFKEEDTMGGGTIFKSVTKNDMERIVLMLPVEALTQQFEQLVEPLDKHIENLTKRNTTLHRTRDLLLPKLVSGDLDVSELDIAVPEDVL